MLGLTTKQAVEKFQCPQCERTKEGCKDDCVLSSTGSLHCQSCNGRVWFADQLGTSPWVFDCVYCGEHNNKKR